MAKFLDLNLFDHKFKLAKKESESLKAVIKQSEDVNFDTEIKELELKLISNESDTIRAKNFCKSIKQEIEEMDKEVIDLTVKIKSKPVDFIDIDEVKKDISRCNLDLKNTKTDIEQLNQDISKFSEKNSKIKMFVDNWDSTKLRENKIEAQRIKTELDNVLQVINRDEDQLGS